MLKVRSTGPTANLGPEAGSARWLPSRARHIAEGNPQDERGGVHQFYTPSGVDRLIVKMLAHYAAMRGSAFYESEASLQAVNEAKDNGRIYGSTCGAVGMFASCRRPCVMRFVRRRLGSARSVVQSGIFVEKHNGNVTTPMNKSRRVGEHGRNVTLTLNHCEPRISGNSMLNHKWIDCRYGLHPS